MPYNNSVCRVKKSLIADERDEKERRKFQKMIGGLDIRKFIFIDEMGSNLAMTRLYGRAEPGERVFDKVPGDHGRNVSTFGAIGLDGIRTGLSVPGAIDGETMVFFVEELLAPTLKRLSLPKLSHLRGFGSNLNDLSSRDSKGFSKSLHLVMPRSWVNKALANPMRVNAKSLGNDKR